MFTESVLLSRLENTLALTFSWERFLKIFRLLPLVGKFEIAKNLFGSILSIWFKILYTYTTSALKRRCSSVGIPGAFNPFSEVRPDNELAIRDALLCTFSSTILSF